jgi:hypothetical protein
MVTLLELLVMRATTATAAGRYLAFITRGGDSILEAINMVNTVGAQSVAIAAPQLPLLEGNTLDARTADGSTGGTVDYRAYAYILEIP